MFDSQIDADLEKLIGWQDARIHASMLQGQGPSMSQGWVGNLLDVSGTVTEPPTMRLYELWLQQKLFGGALSIRAGIEGADSEFILSTTASLFLNSTFPWPDWMAVDLPGDPGSAVRHCRRITGQSRIERRSTESRWRSGGIRRG